MGRRSRQLCKALHDAYGPLDCGLAPDAPFGTADMAPFLSHPRSFQRIKRLSVNKMIWGKVTPALVQQLPLSFGSLASLDLGYFREATSDSLTALAPLGATLTALNLEGCPNNRYDMLAGLGAFSALGAVTMPCGENQRGSLSSSAIRAKLAGKLASLQRLPRLSRLEFPARLASRPDVCGADNVIAALAALPSLVHCKLPPLEPEEVTPSSFLLLPHLTHLDLTFTDGTRGSNASHAYGAMLQAIAALTNLRSLHLHRGTRDMDAEPLGGSLQAVAASLHLTSFALEEHVSSRAPACGDLLNAVAAMQHLADLKVSVLYALDLSCVDTLLSLAGPVPQGTQPTRRLPASSVAAAQPAPPRPPCPRSVLGASFGAPWHQQPVNAAAPDHRIFGVHESRERLPPRQPPPRAEDSAPAV
jgi:hypothetical protein